MATVQDRDVERVVAHCIVLPNLATAQFNMEYFNTGLPLCIIDTVFSRGVRYEGTKQVIQRYCDYCGIQQTWPVQNELPPQDAQQSVRAFVQDVERVGIEEYTSKIFVNRQRTSTKNGILKAEASYRFGMVLLAHGANYLQDIPALASNAAFHQAIRAIPGQKNALSYFFITCGLHDFVNPGRWVVGFVEQSVGRPVRPDEAQRLVTLACAELKHHYPHLTPALLDHCIWLREREL